MGLAEFNVEFQVLDINTSYNLLLGRPFIHMVGDVPSTLHKQIKFIWKDEEWVIHGEGSHSDRYAPIVDEVSRDCDFYMVELNGFEPGHGLGKRCQGIIKPIQVFARGTRFGLGYIPMDDEAETKNTSVDQALTRPFPHLYQSFSAREYVNNGGLGEGIWVLSEEIDAVIEEEVGTSGIRDVEPEQLKNWTSTPLLISRSSRDMPGLSTNMVSHKLPINPDFSLVKQKTQKFKPELSLKIKEEITKQIESKVVEVTQYPTWLDNVVPVAKKDGKIRICIDYRDLNKILMDEEDGEKIAFITPWGVYHYRVMPFVLKNIGATYMSAMTTIFHDMIHKEIELNPAKCAFGVPAGKLLGFTVSRRGIELDPSKIKAIQESPPPKTKKECTGEYQTAFDAIKNYLSNLPVLVPPREGSPLLLYLSVSDNAFGCVLGQHYETGKKERVIYYLNGPVEVYIFQKAMPTEKLAKRQMLLSEFDIVYVTQKMIKAQALVEHLAENPVDEEYESLETYFPDEEIAFVGEDISEAYPGYKVFFDGTANHQEKGIRAILVSETGQHYPMVAKL
ncbi:uncharacterized protein LOC125858800 [Solanum stenotomum]|uniref:uncharacterized protein LOC125858800 n=1 Tax=Solanum stenotomum TaxID=172797 RepID=UPI0020D019D5|nr:uncharacterized protein LOC125858800 [Solanum stenotomum]